MTDACGGTRHWDHEIIDLSHECNLIPPFYVKPIVRRLKHDSNEATATVDAAQRPPKRFVAVKSKPTQSDAMLFPNCALSVRQRTQTINFLRDHFVRFGVVAPIGAATVAEPLSARVASPSERIAGLDPNIRIWTWEHEDLRRLMTIPGIDKSAHWRFARPMESLGRRHDLAALPELIPRQDSTGGRQSKMVIQKGPV